MSEEPINVGDRVAVTIHGDLLSPERRAQVIDYAERPECATWLEPGWVSALEVHRVIGVDDRAQTYATVDLEYVEPPASLAVDVRHLKRAPREVQP